MPIALIPIIVFLLLFLGFTAGLMTRKARYEV
jgi:hypothetical protein